MVEHLGMITDQW